MLFERKYSTSTRKVKLFDEATLMHNPYVGFIQRSRTSIVSNSRSVSRHNPYLPYLTHSPTGGGRCGFAQLLSSPSTPPPVMSQLQLAKASHFHLNKRALASIPITLYCREIDGCENLCAICLDQYDEGDEMRKLPNCSHRFHRLCIDTWLIGSLSDEDTMTQICPNCRQQVDDSDCNLDDIPNESFSSIGELLFSEYSFNEFSSEPEQERDICRIDNEIDLSFVSIHAESTMEDQDMKASEHSDFSVISSGTISEVLLGESAYSDCGFPLKSTQQTE